MMRRLTEILKRELVRNFLVYSIGALFLRGVSFFLIPLYTRALTPDQYGQLELMTTLAAVCDTLFSLGLSQVVFIEYFHLSGEARKEMINSVIGLYLALSSPLYLLTGVALIFIWPALLPGAPLFLVYVALATSFFTFFQSLYLIVLRFAGRAAAVTVLQVILGLLIAGLNIFFIVVMKIGIAGILFSSLLAVTGSLVVAYREYRRKMPPFQLTLTKERVKEYLQLSLPFVPGTVAVWVMNSANRWILLRLSGEHDVGIYAVASKMSFVVDPLLIAPLLSAYVPYILRRFSEGLLGQKMRVVVPGTVLVFALLGFLAREAARFIVAPVYHEALNYIPAMVTALAFWFLAQYAATLLVYQKRAVTMLLCVLAAAVTVVGLNVLLIPHLRIWGVVIAGFAGYLLWFVLVLISREKAKRHLQQPAIQQEQGV